jgi:hypothetical protein
MSDTNAKRIIAWLAFIIGILFMFIGSGSLLGTLVGTSKLSVFMAFSFVIAGIVLAMVAVVLNKRATYIFFAVFFIMTGFYLFLSALGLIPGSFFNNSWPVISVFAGLALLPAGWRRYGFFRSRFLVPSVVLVVLGCVLLVFSFDVVDFSFKQFIQNWWPLLLVLAGLLLVFLSMGAKNKSGENGSWR